MKLPVVSSKKVIRALKRSGFQLAPQQGKGSHKAFYRTDGAGRIYLVIVPMHDPLPKGTLLSIIKQSGIPRDQFIELLL